MQITFLNAAGTVLFVRNDMEEGHWVQEEQTVTASFPFDAGKTIQRGMRICFRDYATGNLEFFEIRSVTNNEPEHGQQITAENIAVSELSDDHINSQDITDKTPAQALTTALSGTLWSVGNASVSNVSSGSFSRGNVWQAVQAIQKNWNCYILPRVTVDSAGNITGRYLDIGPAQGTWRGMYLSVNKNMSDASVTYDDSEVLTALYGYGGTVNVAHTGQDDTQEELTFAGVTWSATSSHPAKPNGQTYLEDPAKTAIYGRNGRPRYGYYQNGDIKDAEILLEKTWEALQATSEPKIQISGTCTDLYRLGYADEPMRLHDTVIVEIKETGEKFVKEIIRLDVNLLDPTDNRPDIGSYIPNIIYINRTTSDRASGGGGGGGRGQTNAEDDVIRTFARLESDDSRIRMVVGLRNGQEYIYAGQIALAINETGTQGSYETTAYINANHVNISATDTAYALAGDLEHDANGQLVIKSAGGMYVRRTEGGVTSEFGVFDNGNLTGGICVSKINSQSGTYIKIQADKIDLSGYVTASELNSTNAAITNLTNGTTTASTIKVQNFYASNLQLGGHAHHNSTITIDGINYQIVTWQ